LTGTDIVDATLAGATTGGISGATDALLSNVEGYSSLPKSQQTVIKNIIGGTLTGKPLDQVLINSAINMANAEVKKATSTKTADASDIIGTLQNIGLTEQQLTDADLFNTGDKLAATDINASDITGIVGQDQLAGPGGLRPLQSGQLQVGTDGLPKYIGIMDFATGKTVPVPVAYDAALGKFTFVADGQVLSIPDETVKMSAYSTNPEVRAAYDRFYSTNGMDQARLDADLKRIFTGSTMADTVTTIDTTAKDVTSTEADKTSTTTFTITMPANTATAALIRSSN